MNRFKKELRRKGIKLECDYLWLPYEENGVFVEAVSVNSTGARWTEYTNVMATCFQLERNGSITEVWCD